MARLQNFRAKIRLGTWLGAAVTALAILAVPPSTQADNRNKTESIVPVTAPAGAALNSPNPRAWRVASTAGDVGVIQGSPPKRTKIRVGAFIMPGAKIESGKDGWVVLTHAKDVMAVAAKTKLSLPKKAADTKTTRILQSLGSILFKVDKLPGRKFEVKTPFLVAGVKGTTFNVNVGATGASVSVSEGTVGVSHSQGGGRTSDVTAGQTASVGAGRGSGVSVGTTSPGAGKGGRTGNGTGKSASNGKGPGAKGTAKGAGPGKGGGKAKKSNGNSGAKGSNGSSASGKSKGNSGGGNSGGGNGNGGGNGKGKGKSKGKGK